ncbi:group II intron maturase-specific domain-containing protein [Acidobacteriota bacterium]
MEFLGYQITQGKIGISIKAKLRVKERLRQLTRRNNPHSMQKIIQDLNTYLRGWMAYYRIQDSL